MKTVKVKNIEIGAGMPKICIPITGDSREEILLDLEEIVRQKPDLAEWRADCYAEVEKPELRLEMLKTISDKLGEIPLLFTFRTSREGGSRDISYEDYVKLLTETAKSGLIQLADVEIFFREEEAAGLIAALQNLGVRVVASNHDFQKTPSCEEMSRRLTRMEELGADILKLAVMPNEKKDLLRLLEVTQQISHSSQRPVITMSMGKIGVLSRICGEITGSSLTFAAGRSASAPGQISAEKMRRLLEELHSIA